MKEQDRINLSKAYFKKLGFEIRDKVTYRGNKATIVKFNGWNTTNSRNEWTGVSCYAVIEYDDPLKFPSKTFFTENIYGIMIQEMIKL